MSETIREEIARDFLFDIWKEAKSSMGDSWDDVEWDSLPEKHKEEYLKTASRLLAHLSSQIEQEGNPYPEDIFPMDINGVGKLLGDKGLTDKEITAVSGCIARLGWLNCRQDILTNFSEEK